MAYDIICPMPKAVLLFHRKREYDDGMIVEIKLWEVAKPVRGSGHSYKYSLFYGRAGKRLIGYDNESGKGDHRHYGDYEERYAFTTIDRLIDDFDKDVQAKRRRIV